MSDPRRIDTHAHIVPDFYREWLAAKGVDAGGLPIPTWSVEAALDFMQTNGIETGIMSVSTPGVEPGDLEEARAMARRLNEYAAQIVSDHPARFGYYATLTLPDVDGAIAEAAYALDELHADGVVLHAHAKGTYLGDAKFEPLMKELNRRKAVIFVHPSELPGGPMPGVPAFVADFLLDSVRAAVNLVHSGAMDRFGDLKIILSHGGGFLPYAAARMAMRSSPTGKQDDGIRLFQRFYFDSALASSKFSLPSLLAFAEPTHITYGSDFPYATAQRGIMFTRALDEYEAADHAAINRNNAELLFPRLAKDR
jgi:6-methylsalicylate decarboxylase